MIDKKARESLAEHLRQLASGAISNFTFEERHSCDSDDPAIHAIEYQLAWPCYDDCYEHRLTEGHKLTDGQRKDFARAVLFLKSDIEYRWPIDPTKGALKEYALRLLTLGTYRPKFKGGDLSVWPFWARDEYRRNLKNQPYLKGIEPNQAAHTTPASAPR